MFGFCGFVGSSRCLRGESEARERLERMLDGLPRANGHAPSLHVDGAAALGSLVSGSESGAPVAPVEGEDGSIVVYDGELYGTKGLRAQLERDGHKFRTGDDAEIVLRAWQAYGQDALDELHGAFSFALWDAKEERLVLARDRIGHKPLFVARVDGGILFGSQLRSVLAHPSAPKALNANALRRYLLFDCATMPATIIEGIDKLEPGHCAVLHRGRYEVQRYWTPTFPPIVSRRSEQDHTKQLRETLREAVRRRLGDELPGVLLSGGTDSTSVLAAITELAGRKKVQTFSIGFSERSFDESTYSREASEYFGSSHHEQILDPARVREILPQILGALDEPLADGSFIPTYMVCKMAAEKVSAVLGGDGGDELLLGYPTFIAHRLGSLYEPFAKAINGRLVRPLVGRLPVSTDNVSFDYKLKRLFLGFDYPRFERHFVWIGTFDPDEQDRLLTADTAAAAPAERVFDDVERLRGICEPRDDYDLLSYLYFNLYLLNDGVTKVDSASRAHGLTVRAPMLDNEFVDMATSMPSRFKFRRFTPKYVLRRSLEGRSPEPVSRRPKKGFGAPLAVWLKGPLKELAADTLSEDSVRKQGLFRPEAVTALWDDHQAGRRDCRKQLWSLIALRSWLERHGVGRA